jgi:hypothetical protein
VLCAVAVIADLLCDRQRESEPRIDSWSLKREKTLTVVLVAVVLLIAIFRLPDSKALMGQTARVFPVKAADFIRSSRLAGPVFNTYTWGGFLIWYLPESPVAIDGRVSLYGDEINRTHFKVTSGKQTLDTDPDFSRARTFLLQRNSALARALATGPGLSSRYRLVYEDDVAMVLVPQ